MRLVVRKYVENGALSGPKSVRFEYNYNNSIYIIQIEQCRIRKIIIEPVGPISYKDALHVYYCLEDLLELFDGQFFALFDAFEESEEKRTDITNAWSQRELSCYESADFMIGSGNVFIDFSKILNSELLTEWDMLSVELDIIHKMFLYCTSSIKMPVDIKCALLVEVFEGMMELLLDRKIITKKPTIKKGESKLEKYLVALMNRYGRDIFKHEYDCTEQQIEKLAHILVCSLNRIAHIRRNDERRYLLKEENIIYLQKLSVLYRVIIFDVLGIPRDVYLNKTLKKVKSIDDRKFIAIN